MNAPTIREIDRIRREATGLLDPGKRALRGQFMTPSAIADFMASLFEYWPAEVHLLDPGAGVGSLSEAFASRCLASSHPHSKLSITAFEIEPLLAQYLEFTLRRIEREAIQGNVTFNSTIYERDFIDDASIAFNFGYRPYTHAILNPPYLKIRADSIHRRCLRKVGIDVVNLYAAFLGLTVALTRDGGEIIAIVPRSFCNGTYFLPFRRWLLERVSIKQIHVFESRSASFSEDDVLQENIIIHLERSGAQGNVRISTCRDSKFEGIVERNASFPEIVKPDDENLFIHVPTNETVGTLDGVSHSLKDLGLTVSTGPVVDFRATEFLLADPTSESAPLLYPHHFSGGELIWPRVHKKPNAVVVNESTRKSLMRSGWYVVTKRFSAKEEERRIVAHVVDPRRLNREWIGFENHLNVYHSRKGGLDPDIAFGLATFLNSKSVDDFFRNFSGHTQVNATDLRSLRYPALEELAVFGKWARARDQFAPLSLDAYLVENAEN